MERQGQREKDLNGLPEVGIDSEQGCVEGHNMRQTYG